MNQPSIADFGVHLLAAARIWIETQEREIPTGTLHNRFLSECESAYVAICHDMGRPVYHDPMWEDE